MSDPVVLGPDDLELGGERAGVGGGLQVGPLTLEV